MHKTLKKQIKKFFGAGPLTRELGEFLNEVSRTYRGYDEDRALLERSLEISSKELTAINQRLKKELENAGTKTQELERLNKTMIGRELKMIELKKEIQQLKSK